MESGVGGRNTGINRALQEHFLDLVARYAIVERGAHVQLELVAAVQRDHQAERQEAAGVARKARPRPDLAPRVARDEVLELVVELGALGQRAVDMRIAE